MVGVVGQLRAAIPHGWCRDPRGLDLGQADSWRNRTSMWMSPSMVSMACQGVAGV